MSSGKYTLWVARALTVLMFTTLSAAMAGIPSASAEEPFNPSAPVGNDPAGVTQDWLKVTGGTTYSYFWNPEGTSRVPDGIQVYLTTGAPVTVYAKHYLGEVKAFTVPFTNAPGASAPNSVTFANGVCDAASGGTYYDVTWNQIHDGTGLVSYRPGLSISAENGSGNYDYYSRPDVSLADGQSAPLSAIATSSTVWLSPGWYQVWATEFYTRNSMDGVLRTPLPRMWVPACGNAPIPAGQVPPGGTTPAPDPVNPGMGTTTGTATGKLTLLRKRGVVKATANASKAASRTTFKLKRPGVRKALVIQAPAGDVVVRTVKTLKAGTYVLKARVKVNGTLRFERVATLTVRR